MTVTTGDEGEKHTDSDVFMQQYSGKLLFAEKIDFHDLSVLVTEKRSMLYEKVPAHKCLWKIIKDDLQTAKMDFLLNIFPLYIQYMQ